jgi:RNA polymerase sigma-70 factor (ECF subfamily)
VKGDLQRPGPIGQSPTELAQIAADPDAFEDFYREHIEAVQRFVARRVPDPHLAADLTADVFLAAIDSAHGYRPGRVEPIAWLYGIARNVVAGEHRRSGRESRAGRRLPPSAELIEPGDLARLHARIDAEAASRRLYAAMEGLSDGERAVLELVALEELSVSEAAGALGIRPVAARVRLHRARRLLQKELGPGVIESTPRLSEASR